MRRKLWPTGLIGRVGLVLAAAVVLELIASSYVFEQAELVSSHDARARLVAVQLDAAQRVIAATEPAQRPTVAEALSGDEFGVSWVADPHAPPPNADPETPPLRLLRAEIMAHAPRLAALGLSLRSAGGDSVGGTLREADGSVLSFRASLGGGSSGLLRQLGAVVVLSACVLLAALIVVRTLAAPLKMLVKATDAIGLGPTIAIVESGPREVRRVAQAFNAMQARIAALLKDRTEALAAVSHDLRTPISRMRLRSGFLASTEEQAAFETDLDEMEAMLNALLAYLGGETDPEKPKRTNLAAILTTLVDALEDAGHAARYEGPDLCALDVRSLGLKRALSNLVNNAVAYGDVARVSLVDQGARVVIVVADDGPGIPEAELAAVFEPFYRVDASRNRAKGGMGLGLAIARQAILREGGRITLANRAGGGLDVEIVLPRG